VNPERVLRPMLKGKYLQVSPTRGNGSTMWVTVHSLVAQAFIGPRPSRRHTVNHINGDKLDNRASNLEWATNREQQRHAASLGLKRHTQFQRLTDDQAREVYATIGQISGREWATRLGVNQVLISSIRTGATYRWATGAPPNKRRGQWFPCTEECECRCHQRRK
jgi:HNH endonuclease